MKKVPPWSMVLLPLLILTLGGCDVLTLSPEDKINAAVSASDDAARAKSALVALASPQEAKQIENEYKSRLKIRALTCSKGYLPPWYKTKADVSRTLTDRACFTTFDAELAHWLKLRRIGFIASKPPLRPLPQTAPGYIVGEGSILNARFADHAGVALLEMQQSVQILDVQTGNTIYREPKGSVFPHAGPMSPNGRLFITGSDGRVKVCESETGSVIVELPWVRIQDFHWLGARFALYGQYRNESKGKVWLLDFVSGKETPLAWITGPVEKVVQSPNAKEQVVVVTPTAVSRVELTGDDPGLRLVQEKPNRAVHSGPPRLFDYSSVTSDGRYYVQGSRELFLTSLDSLAQERIPFAPCNIGNVAPTPDPDRILVSCIVGGMAMTGGQPAFLYSIGERRLYPVNDNGLMSSRFVYVPFMKKMGVISDAKITLLDELPLGVPLSIANRPGDAIKESLYRKMQSNAISRGIPMPVPPAEPPLKDLAEGSRIEAIGVYEGYAEGSRSRRGHGIRPVEVRVGRSSRPIVLVLSSYESVQWRVITESGARLAAVLLSGYNPSRVEGIGSVRIITIGNRYAYKLNSSEYHALENEVLRYTGKRIDFFQGRYQGQEFSVGG